MSERTVDFMSTPIESLRGYSWVEVLNMISFGLAIIGMRHVHMEFDQILAQINCSSEELVTEARYTSNIFKASQILVLNPKLNDSLSIGGSKNDC